MYPPQSLSARIKEKIVDYIERLSKALHVVGIVNIQYVVYNDEVYVIEVNPRSSRTVPYISKVTGIPMVRIATRIMLGRKLSDFPYGTGLYREGEYVAVKVPVFSFDKLHNVDTSLGPEMKSTGEVLGIAKDLCEATFKGLIGAGFKFPKEEGSILFTVRDTDKPGIINLADGFSRLGYKIFAAGKTAHFLNEHNICANVVRKINEGSPNVLDLLDQGKIDMVVNTATRGRDSRRDGFKIRRKAVERSILCLTNLDTAYAVLGCLMLKKNPEDLDVISLDVFNHN